ncbi:hypothetical protein Ocin01_04470 [Orchesella cincta]|uniref:Protein FAM136A n=1 Tax=Orchesella cincta TaxID=48709 RepID=A0A1D2NAC6_ORCCI|nr:hypothetical protein Ocin01_04470 [Orchesella cincta]
MSVSADAMDAQRRVQEEMGEVINEIDKSHLRRIQRQMHECAAKCCANEVASLEDTHGCIEKCSASVHVAQNYVQKEVGGFQERLQRCVLDCQDKSRDKLSTNASESEMLGLKNEFEHCAIRCVDDNLKLLPTLLKRMKASLDKASQ